MNSTINSGNTKIELDKDYTFNNETDDDFSLGVIIDDHNIVINGNNHTIDGKNQARVFAIFGDNITINNLIIVNGDSPFFIMGDNIITNNITFINCSRDEGGAVSVKSSGSYTSNFDKFIDNYAEKGSAIYSESSVVKINNATFINKNSVVWSLIYGEWSNIEVVNTTFRNITSRYATAIFTQNSRTNIKQSKFHNLIANVTAGAAAFKMESYVIIEDCEFINVSSAKNGGAVFVDINEDDEGKGHVKINNVLFKNCSSNFGGAVLQLGGELEINRTTFKDNLARYGGGALYYADTETTIKNTLFDNNTAGTSYGGAIFSDLSKLTITYSQFRNVNQG